MATLAYKTRGNASPQGKPRVYYCVGKWNQAVFDEISAEILSVCDCVIWYNDHPTKAKDKALEQDLTQMQLFVMPVNSNILLKPNRARDIDLPFAKQNHIPVLPILLEGGIDGLFNEVCGNLQYLDKCSRDVTAISYESKLQTFLQSTLLLDDMREQIKKAFDGYLFLSYRKKDRAEAQRLMKLIHDQKFARDMAIWYDEFLIPGENFNDSIAQAMDKSKLFVMAVTPNMVNETNYVAEVEYPQAKRIGKDILPIELVKTDKNLIQKTFENIPAVIDANDGETLSQALLSALQDISGNINEKLIPQKYFIALAYLYGVDVEVDAARAVKMITDCAYCAYPPAMQTLADLYFTGNGVALDKEASFAWQRRIVYVREAAMLQEETEQTIFDFICAYEAVADRYYAAGEYQRASDYYNRARLVMEEKNAGDNLYRASLYEKAGVCCKQNANYEWAKKFYQKSLDLLAESEQDFANKKQSVSLLYRIGDILITEGDFDEALALYQQAFALCEALLQENTDQALLRLYCIIHEKLGDCYAAKGLKIKADGYYENYVRLAKEYAEQTRTAEAKRALSIAYERMGKSALEQRRFEQAEEMFARCMGIRDGLFEKQKTFEAERDYAVCYLRFGDLAYETRDLDGALAHYDTFLERSAELYKNTGSLLARHDTAVAWERLGLTAALAQANDRAADFFNTAFEIFTEIAQQDSSLQAQRAPAVTSDYMGFLYLNQGEYELSKQYFMQGLNIREAIVNNYPEQVDMGEVRISFFHLCELAREMGDDEMYAEYEEYADEPGEYLFNDSYSSHARHNNADSYIDDGDDAFAQQDYYTAINSYMAALGEGMEDEDREMVLTRMDEIYFRCAYQGSHVYYKEWVWAFKLCKELAAKYPERDYERRMSVMYGYPAVTATTERPIKKGV